MLLKESDFWASLTLTVSVICLLVMIIAIVGVRLEWFDFRSATNILTWAARVSVFIFASALVQLLVSRKHRSALVKSALAVVLLIGPLVVLLDNRPSGPPPPKGPPPAGSAGAGGRPPPLNDISTDTQNPPMYRAVVALHSKGNNSVDYDLAKNPGLQKKRFPDIAPIASTLSEQEAFQRALQIAQGEGWDIIAEGVAAGTIEAVASTFYFGFKDDVVIRVRAADVGSIVDIRSHSRVGRGDRGMNAARVRSFIEAFSQ